MRPCSSLVVGISYAGAAGSVLLSFLWILLARDISWFEPAVQSLGLISCLTGVLVERRAAARERRQLAMAALAEEMSTCVTIFDDPRFVPREGTPLRPYVYPRLPTSATESALISGAFSERRDVEMLRRLYAWRESANGFNRRLDLTELRLFTVASHKEIGEFERALHRDDGYLNELRHDVRELTAYLGLTVGQVPASSHACADLAPSSRILRRIPSLLGRIDRVDRAA